MLKAIVTSALTIACANFFVINPVIASPVIGCQPKTDPMGCSGKGAPLTLSLEGVPDIPWCRIGQTPKTHNCRNGSKSGGLYLVVKNKPTTDKSKPFRSDGRRFASKEDKKTCRNEDGTEVECFGAPDSKGGSTRFV